MAQWPHTKMISLNDVTMMSEVHPKVAVIEISV